MQQDTADEVIENLADFGVAADIVCVWLDEFVFADRQVGQDLVVEIYALIHYL